MPALTRRRSPDSDQEAWMIHYDIRVGSIAMRAGVRSTRINGAGALVSIRRRIAGCALAARPRASMLPALPSAWQWLLPKFTEADFIEYRRHRAFDAWKRAMWDAGLKRRPGAMLLRHVYAAHMTPQEETT
jgi:hypothetical protein